MSPSLNWHPVRCYRILSPIASAPTPSSRVDPSVSRRGRCAEEHALAMIDPSALRAYTGVYIFGGFFKFIFARNEG